MRAVAGSLLAAVALVACPAQEPRLVAHDFFGVIDEFDLDGWSTSNGGATVGGPASRMLVGPADFVLSDGTQVHVPPRTPGGNLCKPLFRDTSGPDQCLIIGKFAEEHDAAWYGLLFGEAHAGEATLAHLTAINEATATVSAFHDSVVEFPVAPRVRYEGCSGQRDAVVSADEAVVPDAGAVFAIVDLESHELVGIGCAYGD